MSRQPRIVLPDYPHHVVVRGNNRRRLFSYPSDYGKFLLYLRAGLERAELALHALTMMSNHVHLVLRAPGVDAMAQGMKLTLQRYAKYRNRAREASGKLFESRYLCIPITDDEQLAVVTYYTDVNALRAGKVKDAVDYPWSTYAIHAGQPLRSSVPYDLWTPSPWYLALGPTANVRAARYRERVAWYLAKDAKPAQVTAAASAEMLSAAKDGKRFERPDRTRACDRREPYNTSYEPRSLVEMRGYAEKRRGGA
jgi:putative transposase